MHTGTDDARRDRVYEFGPFHLNSRRRLLECASGVVPLTAKVFDILLYLLQERGRLVSKEELLAHVWPDAVVEEGNLARHISTLRKVLGDDRETHRYIVTVSGQGYRFVGEVREVAPTRPGIRATARRVPRLLPPRSRQPMWRSCTVPDPGSRLAAVEPGSGS